MTGSRLFLYSGNEGSLAGLAEVSARGMGRLVTAAGWKNPKPGLPWCLDNGAFSAYRQGRPFDGPLFERVLRKVPSHHRPDFAVIPDIVAGGLNSLLFSLAWLPRLPHGWPWYLAVQDGMTEQDVEPYVCQVAGLFVGGTLEWKHATAERWVAFARRHQLKVHVGRVGSVPDLAWAERIGADSADSTTWARNGAYHKVDAARAQARLVPVAAPVICSIATGGPSR